MAMMNYQILLIFLMKIILLNQNLKLLFYLDKTNFHSIKVMNHIYTLMIINKKLFEILSKKYIFILTIINNKLNSLKKP